MTSLNQDIQDKLKRLTIFEKIIILNITIYIIGWLISKIKGIPRIDSLFWLELPMDFLSFIAKPWSIITYGFTHVEFWHLFFNMLVLYFIGRSFSNLFNIKLSLNVYFLGIISGALAFLFVYNILPEGTLSSTGSLIGASAGVRAALIFLCAYMPNYEVGLGNFRFKLMYFGIVLILLDLPGFFTTNAGGTVAHFGGYALGYFYATRLKKGNDIGKRFEPILDWFISLFSFSKKTKLKTVHRKKKSFAGHTKEEFNEFNKQKKIDIILDKISKSGYDSLTAEEKDFLFRSGKD